MGLKLSQPRHYLEYCGRVVDQIPELLEDGRTPLSVAGLMERRLNSQRTEWKEECFFLSDAIAYSSDGKSFKVVVDAENLRELTPQSKLRNGALVLADGVYEGLKGTEFSRKDLQSISNRLLESKEVKKHPVWQALAREQGLLDSYVDSTFAEMRAWAVSGLRGYSSGACGRYDLDNGCGRLIGVAPEAHNAHGKVLIKPNLKTAF